MRRVWYVARWPLLGLLIAFLAIQLVPYGWHHDNPPVIQNATWPNAQSERIARVSCYSCHSNKTDWPLYSYIAPMSWFVRRDVERGRHKLNFSNWANDQGEADDAIETIQKGTMPPRRYTLLHRDARLSHDDATRLIDALAAMGGREGNDHRGGR